MDLRDELDRFIAAMKQIKQEILKVQDGRFDKLDNPLKNAPHVLAEITADVWQHK
jgi:glycine dehydrogenase